MADYAVNTAGGAITPSSVTVAQGSLWLPPEDPRMEPPGSPRWWLRKLNARLDKRLAAVEHFTAYYNGDHRLAFATAKYLELFGRLFQPFSDNWCRIVVDAVEERLRVEGFRFGGAGEDADREAWDIWQANDLDVFAPMAHTEAIKCGEAALIVDLNPDDERYPRITVEHPSQVIVACDPGNPRRRVAALKRWLDDDGFVMATVWLPEAAYRFRSQTRKRDGEALRWAERPYVQFEVRNPLGVVPVVPLRNNPSMLTGGRSDLEPAVQLQDAINKLATDLLVAGELGAFRQKWATGVDIPRDPETGRPLNPNAWRPEIDRMVSVAHDGASFGEFSATDLKNYVEAIDMFVQHLAAQTRTPPHYLLAKMANLSGDALDTAETGLHMRALRKIRDFSDPHEEAMRLAFRFRGTPADMRRAEAIDAEVLWADPANKSLAELVDAAVKLRTIGAPYEACWELVGASPQKIQRWKTLAGLPERPPAGATTPSTQPGGAVESAAPNGSPPEAPTPSA